MNVYNQEVVINEDQVERNERVLHPEMSQLLPLEDKKHPCFIIQ